MRYALIRTVVVSLQEFKEFTTPLADQPGPHTHMHTHTYIPHHTYHTTLTFEQTHHVPLSSSSPGAASTDTGPGSSWGAASERPGSQKSWPTPEIHVQHTTTCHNTGDSG